MRAYIAGKLGTKEERHLLEKIERLCKKHNIDTFLPHREAGLAKGIADTQRIFNEDILQGLDRCDVLIASLEGLHVGAGTAWEIGYAYAKKMPLLAIKSDEPVAEAFSYLSPIIIACMTIVNSFEKLEEEIKNLI